MSNEPALAELIPPRQCRQQIAIHELYMEITLGSLNFLLEINNFDFPDLGIFSTNFLENRETWIKIDSSRRHSSQRKPIAFKLCT
jgi:hypothetical protein